MSKTLKIILGGILLLIVLVFVVPIGIGIMSAINPGEAIELAKQQTDLNLLAKAVSESLGKESQGANIVVDKSMDNKKVGTITFLNDSEEYWYISLKKTDESWLVLGSGDSNDLVACSMVDSANYPVELVPTCFDAKTQKLVERN